jgi:hypothetical protein
MQDIDKRLLKIPLSVAARKTQFKINVVVKYFQ